MPRVTNSLLTLRREGSELIQCWPTLRCQSPRGHLPPSTHLHSRRRHFHIFSQLLESSWFQECAWQAGSGAWLLLHAVSLRRRGQGAGFYEWGMLVAYGRQLRAQNEREKRGRGCELALSSAGAGRSHIPAWMGASACRARHRGAAPWHPGWGWSCTFPSAHPQLCPIPSHGSRGDAHPHGALDHQSMAGSLEQDGWEGSRAGGRGTLAKINPG